MLVAALSCRAGCRSESRDKLDPGRQDKLDPGLDKRDPGDYSDRYKRSPGGLREKERETMTDETSTVLAEAVSEVDDWAATELGLFINNDYGIYTSLLIPAYKNLERKHKAGRFDQRGAVNILMKVCYQAAPLAHAQMDEPGRWDVTFPKRVRELAAHDLLDYLLCEWRVGNSFL